MADLAPSPKQQFFNNSGVPLAGGKLYTYAAGTTTPQATYSNRAASSPNPNPIVLNSRGEAVLFLDPALVYDFKLESADGALVYTQPDVAASNGLADLASTDAGKGAEMVGFKQAGAGAVGRDLLDKARETISVKDFGAKGDGITDDTAAIQAAVNYVQSLTPGSSNGARLFIPNGDYRIRDSILVTAPIEIQGAGAQATKIAIDMGSTFDVTSAGVIFRDLFIPGGYAWPSNGIKLTNGNGVIIERCTFQNNVTGIDMTLSYAVEVISCVFDVCYSYGIYSSTSCHNLMVERCGFFTCGVMNGGHAINISAASDNIGIKDNDFEYCNVNIQLHSCNSVEITGNYFEYHDDACFFFGGTCTGIIIEANWIALGHATNGGFTATIANIKGGRFRHNTIYNQAVVFDSATLEGFTVGLNQKTGTGTLGGQPWITPTYLNSWGQQTSYTAVGYMKDENGWVHLRGMLLGGAVPDALFTLPAPYRPPTIAVFAAESSNGASRIEVHPDGNVLPVVAAGNNPSLDGIRFYVGN
ncbi:glycosyl hydrolase family 28-related protein [Luteimonas sp. FXH3W]|uniref:Glycosyl hydrolase family 28-related protein n=1 Tax=Aquilutibacter rugosus TaxID=3115820 RepID=A0ABU7V0T4_9GAMM